MAKAEPKRITVVTSEVLGRPGTGGAGTSDSLLALALGRHGHRVELVVASGRETGDLDAEWTRNYESAGIEVRGVQRLDDARPDYLARPLEVLYALRAQPPDIVIANDWRGLAYAALRTRSLGRGFDNTAFVIHCHGSSRWLAEAATKLPDRLARFGQEVAERAAIELADAVVSPSVWLLKWMRERGWPVPSSARVIQYPRQSAVLHESPAPLPSGLAVRRLAFFGPLREGKGIRLFAASLNALEPDLLDGVEILFLGGETPRWTRERITDSLESHVVDRVSSIRFERLNRTDALGQLRSPGTLAVMPSLLDNSPNTVSECIEYGIPFVAARTGGISELVAGTDRERVLFEPTESALTGALRRALKSTDGVAPAQAAHDPRNSLAAWFELIETIEPPSSTAGAQAKRVDVIATGAECARRAQRLARETESVEVNVVSAESRRVGLARGTADWVVFLDDDDAPDDSFLDELVAAQAASGADVVTAAVRSAAASGGIQGFLGSPGPLGLVENQYGVVGMLRRELAAPHHVSEGFVDPDWPLFARLALSGARTVSIPEPLSHHTGRPGQAADVPGEGLAVLLAFEEPHSVQPAGLPQLAATLSAANSRLRERIESAVVLPPSPLRRLLRAARRRLP